MFSTFDFVASTVSESSTSSVIVLPCARASHLSCNYNSIAKQKMSERAHNPARWGSKHHNDCVIPRRAAPPRPAGTLSQSQQAHVCKLRSAHTATLARCAPRGNTTAIKRQPIRALHRNTCVRACPTRRRGLHKDLHASTQLRHVSSSTPPEPAVP